MPAQGIEGQSVSGRLQVLHTSRECNSNLETKPQKKGRKQGKTRKNVESDKTI